MKRQPAEPQRFRAMRSSKTRGMAVALHAHSEAQLISAASGTMQVYTTSGRWLVPPQLSVWLPPGVPHRVEVLSDTKSRMMFWHKSALQEWAPAASLDRAFALRMKPLLRELICAAFESEATPEKAELVARLILHQLIETPDAPTFLPLPASAIGRRVADLAMADPRMDLDIHDLALRAATSVRTISRLFPVETGLTFKAWRQRARVVLAMDQLSARSAISRVAADAGFASTAAFCFAFRQVTKMTTSAFLDQQGVV
jgi:AraC-like DNA-binding protein